MTDNSVPSRAKLFLVLVLFKPTMESTLHLNLSGEARLLYMGAPYPCHQGIKICNKHNRKKNKQKCVLLLNNKKSSVQCLLWRGRIHSSVLTIQYPWVLLNRLLFYSYSSSFLDKLFYSTQGRRYGGCRVCWAYGPRTLGGPRITTLVDTFFIYEYLLFFLLFSHLADAFIQSDLQIRKSNYN